MDFIHATSHIPHRFGQLPKGYCRGFPNELTIPERATVRIEESQMIVRKNGVAFVASPRDTTAFVGTGEVPMEVLQRASEQPQ